MTMAWAEGQLGFAGGDSVPHPMQGCPVLDRWAGWTPGDPAGGRPGRGLTPAGLRQMLAGILGWMRKSGPAVEQEVGQPGPGEPCYFRVRHGHGSPGGKLEGREGTRIAWGTGKTTLSLRAPICGPPRGDRVGSPCPLLCPQNTRGCAGWQQLLLSSFAGLTWLLRQEPSRTVGCRVCRGPPRSCASPAHTAETRPSATHHASHGEREDETSIHLPHMWLSGRLPRTFRGGAPLLLCMHFAPPFFFCKLLLSCHQRDTVGTPVSMQIEPALRSHLKAAVTDQDKLTKQNVSGPIADCMCSGKSQK